MIKLIPEGKLCVNFPLHTKHSSIFYFFLTEIRIMNIWGASILSATRH